jgi:hypothetical protein
MPINMNYLKIEQYRKKNIPKNIIVCTGCFSIFVCSAFIFLIHKIDDIPFFNFGPSEQLKFFHVSINTWGKWFLVIVYVIFSTLFACMVTEIVLPWILTQVQDISKPVPAKEWQIYMLIQVYYLSWSVQTVITTYLYFSQLDIVIAQMIVYNIVSFFTTRDYIKIKNNNKEDYNRIEEIL